MEKEAKPKPKPKPVTTEPAENSEVHKKFEVKVQKIEENICQWIDEETKTLKETIEKDITSIRTEVDSKNIEINSKVQGSIHDLKNELDIKVAEIDEKLNNLNFNDNNDTMVTLSNGNDTGDGWVRAVLDLKNKLHKNCNTLRFLCSEPLSVQWSVWHKGEFTLDKELEEDVMPFNWVNCNVGGAVEDGNIYILKVSMNNPMLTDLVSDVTTVSIPVSGPYLLYLGCDIANMSGSVYLRLNKREKLMMPGR